MNYGKHLYQLNKKQTEAKKKQKQTQVKQIRVRPTIEVGDYQVKLRNLIRFLEEGDKVEISLRFRGREIEHKELGMEVLLRIKKDTEEYADIEREPTFMGRQMMMILTSKKK
jgi:translation initiation factor IF-3